jgi:hypothetical protein
MKIKGITVLGSTVCLYLIGVAGKPSNNYNNTAPITKISLSKLYNKS